MIQYMVTVWVPADVHDEWLEYMTHYHVADVVHTGCFVYADILRVVDPVRDDGITVYTNRYTANSIDDVVRYRTHFAAALQADHTARFGDRVQATRVVSEVVAHIR